MQAPIYFDDRWSGNHGIGRFATEIRNRLPGVVPLRIMGRKLSLLDPLASTVALAGRHTGCYLSPGFNPPLHSPIPFAFTIHDLVHVRVPQETTAVRRLYYNCVVRPAARKAFRILTVSEYSRQDILEWARLPADAVRVVGNGVSPVFTPSPNGRGARKPFLLHVGRRAGHKNIGNLLQSFAMSRSCRNIRLVFTGDPDSPTQALIARHGLADVVSFSGPADDVALATLYGECIGLVFPSLFEGFGLPIIEAMACGTPVITSSTTSMPEIAGAGNALFVDPTSPESLASAIDALVEDSGCWERLASAGLKRAAHFSWEQVTRRVRDSLLQ